MTALLQVDGLNVTRDGIPVLRRIHLQVRAGEMLVLAGPNGSGKSTLLRALCGLQSYEGVVTPSGLSHRQRARFMAYMPQYEGSGIPFSVAEVVAMGRAPWQGLSGYATAEDRDFARKAMESVGVTTMAAQGFAQLSGGERQRVLLARALCQNTRLLLLDEPTSALDYAHQERTMAALRHWCQEQRTGCVVVLHDLNLAAMYADRMLLLKDGTLCGEGAPAEMLSASVLESVYTCKLLVDEHPCTKTPRISLSGLFRQPR